LRSCINDPSRFWAMVVVRLIIAVMIAAVEAIARRF
jgi:hypothetical protein